MIESKPAEPPHTTAPQTEPSQSEPPHTEHGDRTTALGAEILRTVVGSGVHGIEIGRVQGEVEALLVNGRTPLPEVADLAAITAWSVAAHRRHWGWTCS